MLYYSSIYPTLWPNMMIGPSGGYGSLSMDQMLHDYIKPLGIPAYSGAMIGHITDQFLMPVGVKIRMNASLGTIEYLEKSLL